MTEEVKIERKGAWGVITLNRPKALNALTLEMIRALHPQLAAWQDDAAVEAVLIKGEGEKAFCAGGDVRAVYYSVKGEPSDLHRVFFAEEYRLNRLIHHFPKPFVALIDGVTMGGGVGLSVHGSHRVATERTLVAMPETGIGLFPDVGGSWFLPRCPGRTGIYAALTGARFKAADALHIGFATDVVASDDLATLETRLLAGGGGDIDAVLSDLEVPQGQAPIAAHREVIDRCFAGDSVEAVLAALEADGSAFAEDTLKILAGKSPTSLRITLEEMRRGEGLTIEEALVMEYRMTQGCMAGHDFFEGIRAVLVDKDHSPAWAPADLASVTPAMVARHFEVPPAGDLDFSG